MFLRQYNVPGEPLRLSFLFDFATSALRCCCVGFFGFLVCTNGSCGVRLNDGVVCYCVEWCCEAWCGVRAQGRQ